MTKIYYCITPLGKNPVSNFLDSLPKSQQSKLIRIFHYIKEYGIKVPIKNTKKLSGYPLWEIRILGKDSIRVIYATVYKGDILLLHGFAKKSQKTPSKDLSTAYTRYQEWLKTNS